MNNDLKETWNYQIFVNEYNNIAKSRNGFNYKPDEIDDLEEFYNSNAVVNNVKEYASVVYWSEQLVDTISAKYTGAIIPNEKDHLHYFED